MEEHPSMNIHGGIMVEEVPYEYTPSSGYLFLLVVVSLLLTAAGLSVI